MLKRLFSKLTEKNIIIFLTFLFLILSVAVALSPYNPEEDQADATTNHIWIEYYSDGVYHIPFDEWEYGSTQSVVVEHNGEFVVVNEKGPGHVFMLIPFYLTGLEVLFAPLLIALATFSSYMLGKRLFGWRIGAVAALFVMTNATVIVMWHRYYWTDASTMHLFILSAWLLVEANYHYNGRTLDPDDQCNITLKNQLVGTGLGILSGIAFGASVSTRYPTAILLIALMIYLVGFYILRAWPSLKRKDISKAMKSLKGLFIIGITFLLGLMCVLIPLFQYNAEYFGSPLSSGYDATTLMSFDPNEGIVARNTSVSWTGTLGTGLVNAVENFAVLIPIFIIRMPFFILAPIGIWYMRRNFNILFLSAIIALNLFTYLSLSWVDMYTRLDMFTVLWEPRYFMPALPAIAIFGALGISYLNILYTKISKRFNVGKRDIETNTIICLGVISIVALLMLIPASNYILTGGAVQQAGPPGPNQQPNTEITSVVTDQLMSEPEVYQDSSVMVQNATILEINSDRFLIQSQGSIEDAVTVSFNEWPSKEIPLLKIGDTVEVSGRFMRIPTPEGPSVYSINIKYDTNDYVRKI